jgi:hypothetical protein
LYLFASTNAATTDNTLGRVIGEIRVGFVFLAFGVIVTFITVAHFTQTYGSGHVLQFTVAVGGTGQAIEWVIRDVEFHDPFSEVSQLGALGTNI